VFGSSGDCKESTGIAKLTGVDVFLSDDDNVDSDEDRPQR